MAKRTTGWIAMTVGAVLGIGRLARPLGNSRLPTITDAVMNRSG